VLAVPKGLIGECMIRDKNPVMRETIERLHLASKENKAPIWDAVAKLLNKPSRRRHEVNLFLIERNLEKGQVAVVPGTVLGAGELTKPVTIAAMRFSQEAEDKIKKAKGSVLSIDELVEKRPKGQKVRILG
jgi:large subunit ribosomal protein L18e